MRKMIHLPTLIIVLVVVYALGCLLSYFIDISPFYLSLILLAGILLNGLVIMFEDDGGD